MNFSATPLADGVTFIVEGTDLAGKHGTTLVNGEQWALVQQESAADQARALFDDEVKDFFAPLTKAIDKVRDAAAAPQMDELSYVVTQERVDGVEAQERHLVKLTTDSIILRAIEEGKVHRLRWVGEELVVLAANTWAPSADSPQEADPVSDADSASGDVDLS